MLASYSGYVLAAIVAVFVGTYVVLILIACRDYAKTPNEREQESPGPEKLEASSPEPQGEGPQEARWLGLLGLVIAVAIVAYIAFGASGASAVSQSRAIGNKAGILAILIPAATWLLLHKTWRPSTRVAYAFRFSLWPLIVASSQLGGPLARSLSGIKSRFLMDLPQTLMAVGIVSIILALPFFGVGYLIGARRFPSAAAPPPVVPHNLAARAVLESSSASSEEQLGNPPMPAPASPKAPEEREPTRIIKQLKELLDIGAISQEEFDAKKRELLDRL